MSTRSWASPRSPIAHITFWTLDEVFLPHTLSIASSCLFDTNRSAGAENNQRMIPKSGNRFSEQDHAPSLIESPGFLRQHDGDAVADRIGELGGTRDQLLFLRVVLERRLGDRAHQDFQELRVDGVGGAVGRRGAHGCARNGIRSMLVK